MNKVPESIEVTVTSGQEPRKGLLVQLVLGMSGKNDYSFLLGPTNSEGKTQIQKSYLLCEADRCLRLALMDYLPIESGYSGKIKAKVMDGADIKRAIEALDLYSPTESSEGRQEMLKNALAVADSLNGVVVEIKQT